MCSDIFSILLCLIWGCLLSSGFSRNCYKFTRSLCQFYLVNRRHEGVPWLLSRCLARVSRYWTLVLQYINTKYCIFLGQKTIFFYKTTLDDFIIWDYSPVQCFYTSFYWQESSRSRQVLCSVCCTVSSRGQSVYTLQCCTTHPILDVSSCSYYSIFGLNTLTWCDFDVYTIVYISM